MTGECVDERTIRYAIIKNKIPIYLPLISDQDSKYNTIWNIMQENSCEMPTEAGEDVSDIPMLYIGIQRSASSFTLGQTTQSASFKIN